jgi:hypothetical protein
MALPPPPYRCITTSLAEKSGEIAVGTSKEALECIADRKGI